MGWQDNPLVDEQPVAAMPSWARNPLEGMPDTAIVPPRPASGAYEAFLSGVQGSATGLALRGRLPDIVLDAQHAKWYEKALASIGQMGAEVPAMWGGAVLGGGAGTAVAGPVGTILGGGAGAFAVPALIRQSLIEAYKSGTVDSSGGFLNSVGIVLKTTAKEGVVGAATFGAGGVAARVAGKALAPSIGQAITVGTGTKLIGAAGTAAEVGTMVVTPAALDGHLPEWSDFVNAAIVVGFAKGAIHMAAPAVRATANRLGDIYAKTGIRPEQVVADAQRDPTIAAELMAPKSDPLADAAQVVYHGSGQTITKFDTGENGSWFTSSPESASRYAKARGAGWRIIETESGRPVTGTEAFKSKAEAQAFLDAEVGVDARVEKGASAVYPARVAMENPLVVDAKGSLWRDVEFEGNKFSTDTLLDIARERGHDGVIVRNVRDNADKSKALSDVYGVLKSEQVQSAFAEIPRAYRPAAAAETVANAMPEPKALNDVLANINAPIPEAKTPGHINYKYVENADDLHAIFAAGSAAFEKSIAERRAAPKGWDQSLEEARATLAQAQGRKASDVPQGTPALDAQMLQNNAMLIDAAADLRATMKVVAEKGAQATEGEVRSQMLAAQNLEATLAFTLGKNAEVARALNILKATKQMTALAEDVRAMREKYGDDPVLFAKIGLEMGTPAKLAKFMQTATGWEKVVEGWKAGILSGPVTHMANIIGNSTFVAIRPIVDLAAVAIGKVTGRSERVAAAEPFARMFGDLQGAKEAFQLAGSAMRLAYEEGGLKGVAKEIAVGKVDEGPQKFEQFRKAIEGTKGDVIRLPFRALQLADEFFKMVNERGEAYALATRQAIGEGFNVGTREFRERVVDLVQSDVAIAIEAKAAALRFTFNTPLGEKGQAVSGLVRKAHLEMFVPFIRTPGNILKELARMSPLAPLVSEWRAAIGRGGADQAKAMAEIGMGTALMGVVASFGLDGSITGQGSPDPGKKRVSSAAGWQPYSIKIGDTYYNYQRLQPVGTLIGMAADMAEMWDVMTADEADKLPKMVSVAFANAVTNQTFLQGITNIVNAMSDPKRFGARLAQSMAASTVPNIIAQPTAMSDPFVREINSMFDAIRARIPRQREKMLAKRDVWGTEVSTKSRLGGISPITETTLTEDPVRLEADRLGISVGDAPKKVHLGRGSGKLGDVEITPEQRNKFTEISGKRAHAILEPIVNSQRWEAMPDLVKKRIYGKAFERARKQAAAQVFTGEERTALIGQITQKVQQELRP